MTNCSRLRLLQNHTKQRSISLHDLEPGTTYEVVVKAGNHYGISLHSQPLTFTIRGTTFMIRYTNMYMYVFVRVCVQSILDISMAAHKIFRDNQRYTRKFKMTFYVTYY